MRDSTEAGDKSSQYEGICTLLENVVTHLGVLRELSITPTDDVDRRLTTFKEPVENLLDQLNARPENEHDTLVLQVIDGTLAAECQALQILQKEAIESKNLAARAISEVLTTRLQRLTLIILKARPENEHDTWRPENEHDTLMFRTERARCLFIRTLVSNDQEFLDALEGLQPGGAELLKVFRTVAQNDINLL